MKLKRATLSIAILLLVSHHSVAAESAEPEWNGTSLSTWIHETRDKPHVGKAYDVLLRDETPTTNQVAAVNAIRQIGTNALPYLLRRVFKMVLANRERLRGLRTQRRLRPVFRSAFQCGVCV